MKKRVKIDTDFLIKQSTNQNGERVAAREVFQKFILKPADHFEPATIEEIVEYIKHLKETRGTFPSYCIELLLNETEYLNFYTAYKCGLMKMFKDSLWIFVAPAEYSTRSKYLDVTQEQVKEIFEGLKGISNTDDATITTGDYESGEELTEILARKLLFSDAARCFNKDKKYAESTKTYIKFIDENYYTIAKYYIGNHKESWHKFSYVPTYAIKDYFRGGGGYLGGGMATKFSMSLETYLASTIPLKQLMEEIIPLLQSCPMLVGGTFPYSSTLLTRSLLGAMADHREDLAYDISKCRYKAYALFIKPILACPQIVDRFVQSITPWNIDNIFINLAKLAALVCPVSELEKFIKLLVDKINIKEVKKQIIEYCGEIRGKVALPVTESYIKYQRSFGIRFDKICLENDCISTLDYWIKNPCSTSNIFDDRLIYNPAFKKRFAPTVDEIVYFENNENRVNWYVINRIKNLPGEYLVRFPHRMGISHCHSKVMNNISEELLTKFYEKKLEQEEYYTLPSRMIKGNKNLSPAFYAKFGAWVFYKQDLTYPELSLKDIVAALA